MKRDYYHRRLTAITHYNIAFLAIDVYGTHAWFFMENFRFPEWFTR
jgi:hypothetical protein